ncbi:hypothetical protein PVK73_32390, partial [Bacillus thuringiensis]
PFFDYQFNTLFFKRFIILFFHLKHLKMLQVSHTTINVCLSGEREFDFSLLSKILYILYKEDYEFRMHQLRLFCAITERQSNLRMAME